MLDPALKPENLYNIANDQEHLTNEIIHDICTHPNVYLELHTWATTWNRRQTTCTAPPEPPQDKPRTYGRRRRPRRDQRREIRAAPRGNSRPSNRRRRQTWILLPITLLAVGAVLNTTTSTAMTTPVSDTVTTRLAVSPGEPTTPSQDGLDETTAKRHHSRN